MDTTEVQGGTATTPTDDELLAWDWRASLRHEERSYEWLARRTERSASAVTKYGSGSQIPPVSWLRAAAIVLGWGPR